MNSRKITILLMLLLLGATQAFSGGPWLQQKKHAFVQAQTVYPIYSYSSLLMGTFRDIEGINRRTFNSDFGVYAEIGISDKLNIITKIPFKYVRTGDLTDQLYFDNLLPEGNLFGLSNYEFDLKYQLMNKGVAMAISLNSSWNTASFDLDKGLATGYDANSIGMTFHVGRGAEKHYGFAEIGYQVFGNDFSDMLEFRVEHGWKLNSKMYAAAALDVLYSMDNGDYFNENLTQTGLYPNNQEWAVIFAKVSYEGESGWGANAALPLVPIYLRYVGFNGTLSLGIYKKLSPKK